MGRKMLFRVGELLGLMWLGCLREVLAIVNLMLHRQLGRKLLDLR